MVAIAAGLTAVGIEVQLAIGADAAAFNLEQGGVGGAGDAEGQIRIGGDLAGGTVDVVDRDDADVQLVGGAGQGNENLALVVGEALIDVIGKILGLAIDLHIGNVDGEHLGQVDGAAGGVDADGAGGCVGQDGGFTGVLIGLGDEGLLVGGAVDFDGVQVGGAHGHALHAGAGAAVLDGGDGAVRIKVAGGGGGCRDNGAGDDANNHQDAGDPCGNPSSVGSHKNILLQNDLFHFVTVDNIFHLEE